MPHPTGPPEASRFHTTRWSVVLGAARFTAGSSAALEELCTTYWRPIYAFIRRRGHTPEQARDLTQGFFTLFLERRDVEAVDPSRGRFRAYLLAAVKNFLANEKARDLALKRGAGAVPLSLSFDDDSGLGIEPVDERTPEDDFEHQWALAILRRALERLREEQTARGRGEIFERLKPTLAGERIEGGYAAVADETGLTTVAVKVAVHRLRKRYGELLLEEVARTVELPREIEDEMRYLLRAVDRR